MNLEDAVEVPLPYLPNSAVLDMAAKGHAERRRRRRVRRTLRGQVDTGEAGVDGEQQAQAAAPAPDAQQQLGWRRLAHLLDLAAEQRGAQLRDDGAQRQAIERDEGGSR